MHGRLRAPQGGEGGHMVFGLLMKGEDGEAPPSTNAINRHLMFDTTNPREQKFPQTRHLQQFHNGKTSSDNR